MVLVVLQVVGAMGLVVVISHLCGDTNGYGCGGSQQMKLIYIFENSNICFTLGGIVFQG